MAHELEAELGSLAEKISLVVDLCASLREEKRCLEEQLAAEKSENERLVERMNSARRRLQALADQLPATEAAPD